MRGAEGGINIGYEYTYEHNALLLCSTCVAQIPLIQLLPFEAFCPTHLMRHFISKRRLLVRYFEINVFSRAASLISIIATWDYFVLG